ncbi:hypothetical protein [Clostridium ragsdalei]|uniref:hypothetical protein n=1 Tax=Clostridium ragsdalei TaxID=217158 RepID=UPI000AF1F733|nr:hypothetical protein [Clostridium ragsdalei]
MGDRVWFGAFSKVYKVVTIASDTVVVANSIVTKNFVNGKCIIGGSHCRMLKENTV